jgi:uncharacterized protein (TIGR03437 family)
LVSDSGYTRQQASTTITVVAPLAVGSLTASARNNNTFTTSLSATGGVPPYSWRVTNGSLPAGLSLNSNGQINGFVTAPAGSYPFTATVTDARASTASASLNISVAGPTLATQSLPHAQIGASYSQTLKATGGTPAFGWSVSSGSLPSGLALDAAAGSIGGVPTTAGPFSFTARVADSFSSFSVASLSIVVDPAQLSLSVPSSRGGNVGEPYQFTVSAKGGVAPYQFTLDSGTLPDGITLLSSGDLSGIPTRTGTWNFTIRATDGSRQTAIATITIQVSGPVPHLSNGSLVNAASFADGLAPGEYFSIFGTNLATVSDSARSLPLPLSLGNVTIQWNGAPLPLLAVSPGQINAQIPFTAVPGTAQLKVNSNGVESATVSARVQTAGPGLFQLSPGLLLAINQDGTLNSVSNPVAPGSVVLFYATGCGPYDVPLATGDGVPVDRLYRLALPNSLVIGGAAAELLFVGAAPALGSGLAQINAKVPPVPAGEWPVTLTVAGLSSNSPHIFVSDTTQTTVPLLGHVARFSFEEGLRKTLDWYREKERGVGRRSSFPSFRASAILTISRWRLRRRHFPTAGPRASGLPQGLR